MQPKNLMSVRFVFSGSDGKNAVVTWDKLGSSDKPTWKVSIEPGGIRSVSSLKPNVGNSVYFVNNLKTLKTL